MGVVRYQTYTNKSYITQYDETTRKWPLLVEILPRHSENGDHKNFVWQLFEIATGRAAVTKASLVEMRDAGKAESLEQMRDKRAAVKTLPRKRCAAKTLQQKRGHLSTGARQWNGDQNSVFPTRVGSHFLAPHRLLLYPC